MHQPRLSKLKIRNEDHNEDHNAVKPTGTLRERFENEANRSAKTGHQTGLRHKSTPKATTVTTGRSFLLRGCVATGLLTAGLYWVVSSTNIFQKNTRPALSAIAEQTNQESNSQADTQSVTATENQKQDVTSNPAASPEASQAANLSNTLLASTASDSGEIKLENISAEVRAEQPSIVTPQREIPAASNSNDSGIQTTTVEQATDTSALSNSTQSTLQSATHKVQTYRASIFSHLSSTTSTETPISRGTEVTLLEQRGNWAKVEVNNTGAVGFIHITHIFAQ